MIAGVIDLTESIKKDQDGHPNFSSIVKESTEILKEFQKTLGEKK